MDATVGRDAVIIVSTNLVPQWMVYVKKAVNLDGRVTNVLKVLNNAYNIVLFYLICRRIGDVMASLLASSAVDRGFEAGRVKLKTIK
jgi:hypothetical protein